MIIPLLKTYINSRASYLSPADYKDIMQYRDTKPKPLAQLNKNIKYQIVVYFKFEEDKSLIGFNGMM